MTSVEGLDGGKSGSGLSVLPQKVWRCTNGISVTELICWDRYRYSFGLLVKQERA